MKGGFTRRAALGAIGAYALVPTARGGAAPPRETPLTLSTPTGDIQGTLTFPDGKLLTCSRGCGIDAPLVLIIAGSGPTDHDGNSTLGIKTDMYKLLAQALAARGIGSIRYDKRGIGASVMPGMNETDARFENYVDDATRWLEMLQTTDRPRFRQFFVAGHSEGSLIGMIAGARAKVAGYVSLCGAGRPAYTIIHDQITPQLSADQLVQADAIMAKLRKGEQVAEIPASSQVFGALFHSSIQPYLISWFKYDPAIEIKKLACPIVIVGGTKDVQVPVAEARTLAAAVPSATLTIIDGLSHTLKRVDPDAGVTQQSTYTDPSIPLDPAVIDATVNLVKRAS
jgi:pimeloyl-ACP methyl ester carboxylesterase